MPYQGIYNPVLVRVPRVWFDCKIIKITGLEAWSPVHSVAHWVSKQTIALCALLTLSACGGQGFVPDDDDYQYPVRVNQGGDANIVALENKLKKLGVTIISIGEDNLIAIPSARLFANQSPRLTWQSYEILETTACYLKQLRKVSIQVSAYTVPYGSAMRQLSLSRARAREVMQYLWSRGVDSRIMFAHGQGSEKAIIAHPQGGDASLNSRIEITFREMVR